MSVEEEMNFVVQLSGGRSVKIENGFIMFQNENRSYHIQGVSDVVVVFRILLYRLHRLHSNNCSPDWPKLLIEW